MNSLLRTKRRKVSSVVKKEADPRKNHVNVYHIKPAENKKLELIVFQCHQGGYHEKVMAWPFWNRNDPTHGGVAKNFLEEIQFTNYVYKITDGHGNVQKNPSNYEIKAFLKPLAEDITGKLDGEQIQQWWDEVYIPSLLQSVPFMEEYNKPLFDHKIDYQIKEHWSDCIGIRNPTVKHDIVSDILKLVRDDYLDEGTTYVNHKFETWITQDAKSGSRFYSMFREGFLTAMEIKALQIPEEVLRGQDKANMDAYNANLNSGKELSLKLAPASNSEQEIANVQAPASTLTLSDDSKPSIVTMANDSISSSMPTAGSSSPEKEDTLQPSAPVTPDKQTAKREENNASKKARGKKKESN